MEPFSSPEEMSQEELVVYVEELADSEDYWLSITDAARVCRVQDVSIRRAINKGRLPVRKQRAGQSKRTRFVRASDLPRVGFPIIDESAAITTEIGKVDILSIPRQQQQIVRDHQQLLANLAEIQEALIQEQARVLAHFQDLEKQFQHALQEAQAQSMQQLVTLEKSLAQKQEQLQQALISTEQRRAEDYQANQKHFTELQEAARQQEEHMQQMLLERQQEIQARLSAQHAEFQLYQGEIKQSLESLATTQQRTLLAYQQSVNEQFQLITQETQKQITLCQQSLKNNLETAIYTVEAQLSGLGERFVRFQQTRDEEQQRINRQYKELEHLLQYQQKLLDSHEHLLLPCSGQRLATEEMVAQATRALTDLETKLLAAQKQELARYQPLLAFLITPGRLEALERLLTEKS